MIKTGGHTDLDTPVEISRQLHVHSDKALEILDSMDAGNNNELNKTLTDIRTIAYLGKYYAHKIRGAAELDLYRKLDSDSEVHQEKAIRELSHAEKYWRLYIDTAGRQYKNPLWTNRVGHVNWEQISEWVSKDIDIARALQ
jgi:hypothetical protein